MEGAVQAITVRRPITRSRAVAALALAALAAGCGSRAGSAEGRVLSIEANLASLRKVPGYLKTAGGEETVFNAYFQQEALQMIEETPPGGAAWADRYYFQEGNLFLYRRLAAGKILRQFLIDKRGAVRHAVFVDGAAYPSEEIARKRAHAEELKEAALARAGRPIVLPLIRNR